LIERDSKVVEFVSNLPCFSDTIHDLFFANTSQRVTNRRLAYLYDYGYLNRYRRGCNDKYFYFVGKKAPRVKEHYDYMARTYKWIIDNGYIIKEFEVEKPCGKIRPDLIVEIEQNGKSGIVAVEVERSNNDIKKKIKKYEDAQMFKKLILVSKKKRESEKIDIINVDITSL
jgi:hypothetical protein